MQKEHRMRAIPVKRTDYGRKYMAEGENNRWLQTGFPGSQFNPAREGQYLD